MDDRQSLYERAKSIAVAASQWPPEERHARLTAECAGDAALQREAAWLLQAIEADTATGLPPVLPSAEPSADLSGDRIVATGGSEYRILRRLGRGGMGTVWLAGRRMDAAVQQVALKLLNAGTWQDASAMRRFAEERRILASLDHPNIARLVDAGTMADGQPYLAMEYVQGRRIDVWCREGGLSLAQRVELFAKVCSAVQYAHQHLVIHRDIKPANILVDARGEPKLLDFGIARLLREDDPEASHHTTVGQRMLTLAYASPEQVRGEALTTASDIWSLGAVLYELVSGVHAFEGSGSVLAMSNAILTGRLQPPSRRGAEPGSLRVDGRWRVPADIDAIVMKAMRTRPGDRYPTVAEMGQDLRSFLESRPVQARRGAFWYRSRLYLKRHRGVAAASCLVAGLLIAFGVERERQLHRVEQERDTAHALACFMSDLFENADPTGKRGERITVAEVLDKGVADLDADRSMQAPVRASLLLAIGRAYNALDRGDKALPVLERAQALQARSRPDALEQGRLLAALGRAHSMVIDLPSASKVDAQAIALLEKAPGASQDEILRVRINRLYSELGVKSIPLEQVRQQLQDIIGTLKTQPAPNRELQAQALAALSLALASGGQDAHAIRTADEALTTASAFYGASNAAGLIYYRFVRALVSIRTDPADAVERYRGTVADYDTAYGKSGPGLAGLLSYLGDALLQVGHAEDAEKALRRALAISDSFAALAPDFDLGTELSLVQALMDQGRLDEAEAQLHQVAPVLQERMRSGASWAVMNRLQAAALEADIAARHGQFPQALARYLALDRQLAAVPATQLNGLRAAVLAGLGQAQLANGTRDAAQATLVRLQALNERQQAPVYSDGAIDAVWLGAALAEAAGKTADARAMAAPAAAIAAHRWGEADRRTRALQALARGAVPGAAP